jgi:colanic acid biosynthesis glycosyl transferase WcaI
VADENSELARAVAEGGFGANVLPGDPQALARKLSDLIENPAPLHQMRANTAWVQQFSASRVLSAFEQKLQDAARQRRHG